VFWVFGSPRVLGDNVMLAVATSDALVGPTRLLFPRAPGGVGEAAGFPFSLLGAAPTLPRPARPGGQQRRGPRRGACSLPALPRRRVRPLPNAECAAARLI
jgi:hypothetical protein